MRVTKDALIREIAEVLGGEAPPISTGSTEPKEIFDMVNDVLGLQLDPSLTKPQLAQAIVESSGEVWGVDCESRGGTVTLEGLLAVREAVRAYTGR